MTVEEASKFGEVIISYDSPTMVMWEPGKPHTTIDNGGWYWNIKCSYESHRGGPFNTAAEAEVGLKIFLSDWEAPAEAKF